jgi:diguanylate cyclase (GGDEF)-like protein/PAS domain S-box-containing protein
MAAERIRVIVAAGSDRVREALDHALPGDDYDLEFATSADEIPTLVEGGRGDVLVIQLGDGPGSLAPEALALPEECEIPLLVILASDDQGTPALARGDCSDYLVADQLDPRSVQRAIRYAVARAAVERRRREAERALVESEKRYRSLFEESRDAMFMTARSGRIIELNAAARELLGATPESFIGRHVREIYADAADRHRFQREIEEHGHIRDFEVRLRGRHGIERWCLITAWVYCTPTGEVAGYQGIVYDIESRKEAEDRLLHEAFHDPLTGLPNRALFMDRLERSVARRRRGEDHPMAVLFLDMDRFKVVNDSLGHLAGDELLRRMGRLLAEEVRDVDTVARIGGDEFAILLDRVDDPADATHVAERIQTRLRTPFEIQNQKVFASLSIGIAFGGSDIQRPEDLLRNADTAMYRAKELGPARYQIFDEAMHVHAVTILQLETDLRLALERDQFVVHYQPLIQLEDERIIGFEALVRWQHPQRGLLQPQAFIPIAEDTGLIIPLGLHVLRTGLRQVREWRATAGNEDLFVSVNLSTRQFRAPNLVGAIEDILAEIDVPGAALQLEITESALMQNPGAAIDTLGRLRALGVRLGIDDFGTGFSSLHTLHELPLDLLKIDRSFIARLDRDDEGHIVDTILTLARNLGLDAVAEGVETEAQMGLLRTLRPASVQGFLFSSPLDAEAAARTLEEWSAESP